MCVPRSPAAILAHHLQSPPKLFPARSSALPARPTSRPSGRALPSSPHTREAKRPKEDRSGEGRNGEARPGAPSWQWAGGGEQGASRAVLRAVPGGEARGQTLLRPHLPLSPRSPSEPESLPASGPR